MVLVTVLYTVDVTTRSTVAEVLDADENSGIEGDGIDNEGIAGIDTLDIEILGIGSSNAETRISDGESSERTHSQTGNLRHIDMSSGAGITGKRKRVRKGGRCEADKMHRS